LIRERQVDMQKEKRSITPEKAVEILQGYGTIISLEEAKIILDFMYKIAKLSLDQYIKV
jgi:hypothetical protein